MESVRIRPIALVVEADNLIRMETVDLLQDAGFSVVEAWTSAMALQILETRSDIALVFSDSDLPGPLNGTEIAKLVTLRWPEIDVMISGEPLTTAQCDLSLSARGRLGRHAEHVVTAPV